MKKDLNHLLPLEDNTDSLVFDECAFRDHLGFDCEDIGKLPSTKLDGFNNSMCIDIEDIILGELDVFPEKDFLKLKKDNQKLDNQLFNRQNIK